MAAAAAAARRTAAGTALGAHAAVRSGGARWTAVGVGGVGVAGPSSFRRAASSSPSSSSSSSSSSPRPADAAQEDADTRPSPAPAPAPASSPEQQQQPSFSTSASRLAAEAAAKPLPVLGTAPGYPFPPAVIANAASPPPASSSSESSSAKGKGKAKNKDKPSPTTRDARIYAERKAIVSAATKGYFHDFHALRSHGGKTYLAPPALIRAERAGWWPDWPAARLSDGVTLDTASVLRGRVSIVGVLGSQASEAHVRSFLGDTARTYAAHPAFQHLTLNVQLSALRGFLLRLSFASLRTMVTKAAEADIAAASGSPSSSSSFSFTSARTSVEAGDEAVRRYFLCTGAPQVPARVLEMELELAKQRAGGSSSSSTTTTSSPTDSASSSASSTTSKGTSRSPAAEAYLRSALCMHNKHVGYVFLVDSHCRVRWAGGGLAEDKEREALKACTGALLARQ